MSDELTDEQCARIAGAVSKLMGATGGTLTESEGHYLRNFGFALIRAGYRAALREDRAAEPVDDQDAKLAPGNLRLCANRVENRYPHAAAEMREAATLIERLAAPLPEDRAEPVRRNL